MKNLSNALMDAEAEMEKLVATSTAEAGRYSYKYADLSQVYQVVREPLRRHGVVILQGVAHDIATGVVTVDCTLMHCESGESISRALDMVPERASAQGVGSTITYARRYLLTTMLNLAQDDDDGAGGTPPTRQQKATDGKESVPVQAGGPTPLTKAQAVKWATTGENDGVYKHSNHAGNAYDKLVKEHPDASEVDIKKLWKELTTVHQLSGLLNEDVPDALYTMHLGELQGQVKKLRQRVHAVDDNNPFDVEAEAAVEEARAEA